MSSIINELITVFIVLQLIFGFVEYRYKPDIFYIAERLLTARQYILPSIILPFVYVLASRLITFLFA